MKIADLEGKKILILGYGIEGKATEKWLRKHIPSATVGIADISRNPNYLDEQKNYDLAIKSPGIHKRFMTIPYTTATNIFFETVKGMTIGITGTKGKSTTTSLIYHILKEAGKKVYLAGNIGKPMLEQLDLSNNHDDIFVVELSSYQLLDCEYSPNISIAVSLYPDHLDYHSNIYEYYEAKHNIMKHAGADDVFIYNPAFPEFERWVNEATCRTKPYVDFTVEEGGTVLIGAHNKDNIRGAVTVAQELGIDEQIIRKAIASFVPLRHRLQNVGTFNGITFYDDAISTTPESTIKAIEAIPSIGTIFLGGLDRGYDFTELIQVLKKYHIRNYVFFPDSGNTIMEMLTKENGPDFQILQTRDMKEAVAFAYKHTPENSVCLLSTASPSYSVWKNFEEKGDQFQQWVRYYGETNQQTKEKTGE